MCKKFLVLLYVILVHTNAVAQQNAVAAYEKLTQLTKMFNGKEPYSCLAVVEVKYKNDSKSTVRDTSKLIYKNGSTFYRSKRVERVEGLQGELVINHELKTATFQVSDSIKQVLQRELNIASNKEFEALLDSNFETRDEAAFKSYVTQHCNAVWNSKDGVDEISFTPKNAKDAVFLLIKIRFNKDSKVLYYEYINSEPYATDWGGSKRFRQVTTIYDDFMYDNIPGIPSKLPDFLAWDGWSVKLKKYTNYKFSLL